MLYSLEALVLNPSAELQAEWFVPIVKLVNLFCPLAVQMPHLSPFPLKTAISTTVMSTIFNLVCLN